MLFCLVLVHWSLLDNYFMRFHLIMTFYCRLHAAWMKRSSLTHFKIYIICFIFLEMSSQIISDLKPRSGRSIKFLCKDHIELNAEKESFSLFLFSNKEVKVGVVVRTTELETLKLSVGKSYFVNNLQFHEEKSGIPLFKLLPQSLFRESPLALKESVNYQKLEVDALKTINASKYYDAPLQVKEIQPAQSSSCTLSLQEFLATDPEQIKENQFVEVLDI